MHYVIRRKSPYKNVPETANLLCKLANLLQICQLADYLSDWSILFDSIFLIFLTNHKTGDSFAHTFESPGLLIESNRSFLYYCFVKVERTGLENFYLLDKA